MNSPEFELDAGTLARVDQLYAAGVENLSYIVKRAAEAKDAGWDYPAVATLLAHKLDSDCPHMTRRDMALLIGVAAARLLNIADIAERARHELFEQ